MTNSQTPTVSHIPCLPPLLPVLLPFSSALSPVSDSPACPASSSSASSQYHHPITQLTATSSVPRVPSLPLHTPATPELSRPGLPRRTHAHVHPHAHALTAPQREPPAYPIQPIHSCFHSFIHSLTRTYHDHSLLLPAMASASVVHSPPTPATPAAGTIGTWETKPSGVCRRFSARADGSGSA